TAGDFAGALKIAQRAIEAASSEFWVLPTTPFVYPYANTIWIEILRAHAQMFLGQVDQARGYFFGIRSSIRDAYTPWECMIWQDFVDFRGMGYVHALMFDVERRFSANGWVLNDSNDVPAAIDRNSTNAGAINAADALAK